MLSRYTLKRLSIVFNIMIFFCVLPFDWNRAALRLSYTRSRLKNGLNALIVYSLPLIMVVVIYQYTEDVLENRLSAQGAILNFIILLGAFISLSTSLVVRLCPQETSSIITLSFRFDKYCQELLLDSRTVEELASISGLTIKVLNVLEPLSILHSFGVGMLFYEDYDVFRRYVFRHVQQALGLHGWVYEIGALLVYMGAVRLFYAHLLVLGILVCTCIGVTSFWVAQLTKSVCLDPGFPEAAASTALKRVCTVFRHLQILHQHQSESKFLRVTVPSALLGLFAVIVFSNVITVKYYNILNYSTLSVVTTIPVVVLPILRVFFGHLGTALHLSEEFPRVWLPVARRTRRKKLELMLKSCPKLYFSMCGFFKFNMSAFLEFQSHVIDKTISLLLSVT